ncbi:GatB/YqeY domain-containing protein [Hoyosella sp. YIM 151337]|uniref:GatB/YqeY domain-containing protein n=1 Tax=Hoyosella sp. YIM 151337 TaxID=2992742 RepID=UPI002235E193|nr:GatB/YqeY domain-containing protein [Hoyosella sp. YIM 151337]MCW4354333.1 GatB/YqeY domain-containing protein [Hoyosella sp. YIM 151337]
MSELKAKLREDLTASMKAKDSATTATLRMLIAAIRTEEVSGAAARELTDAEVIKVLTKEAKKRAESATVYSEAGREELASKERAEGDIIARYLPRQLSDEELDAVVTNALAAVEKEMGERPGMRQMGQVMKVASAEVAGRADGSRVAAAVKQKLA